MKTSVCILGSSGLLGRTLYNQFINLDYNVYGTYKNNKINDNLLYFDYINNGTKFLYDFIIKNSIKIIINTIAERNIDICEKEFNNTYKLNVSLVEDLIHICTLLDIKLIHISTDYIYDGQNPPYDINSLPNPLQNYGITKLIAEYRIINRLKNFIILRVPVLYSIEQKNFNESSPLQIIKLAFDLTIENKKIDDYNIRFPTNVLDVSNFLINKINTIGIYNFSANYGITKYEMLKYACELMNVSCKRFIKDNDISSKRPFNTQFKYIYTSKFIIKEDINIILKDKVHNKLNSKDFFYLIDLDGTLLDTDILHYQAYKSAFDMLNIKFDIDINLFYSLINNNGLDSFLLNIFNKETYYDIKNAKNIKMLENKNINTICNSEIFINYLINNNCNYCIVTNTSKNIVEHYKKYNNIFNNFNNFITREDYTLPKPNDECWKKGIEKYYNNEKIIIGIENTYSGYKSLKNITNNIYIVKNTYTDYTDIDTYLFNDYNQIING